MGRGDLKLGLRNSDGTGVPIGVTRVGSVLGYMIEDGVRVPVPGQLYYRGIELNEIVEAHRKAGTFGYLKYDPIINLSFRFCKYKFCKIHFCTQSNVKISPNAKK